MKAHVKPGKAGLNTQMVITGWECVDNKWLNLLCKLAGAGLSRGSDGGFASIPIHVGVAEGWDVSHCLSVEACRAAYCRVVLLRGYKARLIHHIKLILSIFPISFQSPQGDTQMFQMQTSLKAFHAVRSGFYLFIYLGFNPSPLQTQTYSISLISWLPYVISHVLYMCAGFTPKCNLTLLRREFAPEQKYKSVI